MECSNSKSNYNKKITSTSTTSISSSIPLSLIDVSLVPITNSYSTPSPSPSPSLPSSTSSDSPLSPKIVMSPCAACKILRRRCADKCVLAPYFPPTEPLKFTIAHRIFGASNIIKLLQELPESHRADAVSSMVYEANARIRDPVYGCAGAICNLQKQISELQAELAKANASLVNMQTHQANLVALLCMEMSQPAPNQGPVVSPSQPFENPNNFMVDDGNIPSFWDEPLWT